VMVDVMRMPDNSFGTVPTPAIVAPMEFSMRLADYEALGGHMGYVRPLEDVLAHGAWHNDGAPQGRRTRSGVAGMSMWSMSSDARASRIALIMVDGAAIHPAWPAPLTPRG